MKIFGIKSQLRNRNPNPNFSLSPFLFFFPLPLLHSPLPSPSPSWRYNTPNHHLSPLKSEEPPALTAGGTGSVVLGKYQLGRLLGRYLDDNAEIAVKSYQEIHRCFCEAVKSPAKKAVGFSSVQLTQQMLWN